MILLIEQNKFIRNSLKQHLELNNYEVLTARNGAHGYKILQNESPRVVVSNITMPILDGPDLLKILKTTNPEYLHQYWIFMSEIIRSQDTENCFKLGAKAVIHKPIEITKLLNFIARGFANAA